MPESSLHRIVPLFNDSLGLKSYKIFFTRGKKSYNYLDCLPIVSFQLDNAV